jgi:molybdopterin-guanine dinucleotide biosynthesis protein B
LTEEVTGVAVVRDVGLHEAIQAAGGVTELARRIGIAQPSVSNWDRVPADRVIAVEAATGVSRRRLRPDLYTGNLAAGRGSWPPALSARTLETMRIIGLAGWSGSGKTTLITKVIPILVGRGLRVSTVKHAHHGFELDHPGKDSFMHREAGASEVLISSAKRFALLHELREDAEWDLPDLLAKLAPVDMVLVEGFKRDAFPKLEVHRVANGKPLLHLEDAHIVAVAADTSLPQARVPVIDLNDIEGVVDLLIDHAIPIEAAAARVRGG